MVAHTYYPNTQEDPKFKASIGYIADAVSGKKKKERKKKLQKWLCFSCSHDKGSVYWVFSTVKSHFPCVVDKYLGRVAF
jgi:hypothetical protein